MFLIFACWGCRCAAATGPRGPHGAAKQGGTRILADTVNTALENKLREKSIVLIFNWMAKEGYDEQHLDDVSTALPLLRQFVQSAFDLGTISLRSVKAALQGLGEKKYHLLGNLKPVWRIVSSWERGEPVEMRTPMPFSAWRAMFATSVIWRWYAFGVLLAIGFHCLLRPGELLLLTWADVMLSDDLTDCDGSGAVAIGRPKTRFSGGRIQHVLILCRWLGWYIAAVRDAFKPKPTDRIFPFTYACLLARWNELLHALSLPTAWTPSSLRAGGTTHYYRSGAHLEWIRLRGRWKVATSLEHYVQEAVAWLLQNQLSEKTKLIIKIDQILVGY